MWLGHMLSLTCFQNLSQVVGTVHTAPVVPAADQGKTLFEIGLSESSKEKNRLTAFDCCKQKIKKLEQPFWFTFAVPPRDKCKTVSMPRKNIFFL